MTGAEAIQEIAPVFEAYTAGHLADDAQAVYTLYASDALEMSAGMYRNHSDIVAAKENAMESWTYSAWDFEPMDAWVHGDAAYVISRVDLSRDGEVGETVSFEAYSFMRLVKEDGEWKIHRNVAGAR
jgi:ketosteroid isomerase-like protein